MEKMPFRVETEEQASLYRLRDGRFQIVQEGPLRVLMSGPSYILASTALYDLLYSSAPDDLVGEPRVLYHPVTRSEIAGYIELLIHNSVSEDSVYEVNTEGMRIWVMEATYLFVSPALRSVLERKFTGLQFSPGCSNIFF
jgi:hypothetical protein